MCQGETTELKAHREHSEKETRAEHAKDVQALTAQVHGRHRVLLSRRWGDCVGVTHHLVFLW